MYMSKRAIREKMKAAREALEKAGELQLMDNKQTIAVEDIFSLLNLIIEHRIEIK